MYTRPFSIWRKLKPRNFLGMFSPYSSCECGNSFFMDETGNYMTSYSSGRIICYDCYKLHIREIQRRDHAIQSEPNLHTGAGYSYLICSNPFCFWHYEDKRFYWDTTRNYWMLEPEIEMQGISLKQH